MIVVAVAMIGSRMVLPAILSRLGDRVEKGRIPFLSRVRRPAGEGRIWSNILNSVLRHPAISATIAAAALATLAIPTLQIVKTNTGSPQFKTAVSALGTAAAATRQGYGAINVDSNAAHTVGRIIVPLPGNGTDGTSTRALLTLRQQLLPQTIAKLAHVTYGGHG